MLYFFHHYELPLILRRVQLQNLLLRGSANNHPEAGSEAAPGGAGGATSNENGSSDRDDIRTPGSEVDHQQGESETIERDTDDSLPSETPSDDSEMESVPSSVVGTVSEAGTITAAPQDNDSTTVGTSQLEDAAVHQSPPSPQLDLPSPLV